MSLFTVNEKTLAKVNINYLQEPRIGFPLPNTQPQISKYNAFLEQRAKKHDKYTKIWAQLKDIIMTLPDGTVQIKIGTASEKQKVQSKVRQCGIPPTYRPTIWLQLSGAAKKLKENEGYYTKMLDIHAKQIQHTTYAEIERVSS